MEKYRYLFKSIAVDLLPLVLQVSIIFVYIEKEPNPTDCVFFGMVVPTIFR